MDPETLGALGRTARDEGKHDLAIALQMWALRLAPEHEQARADLALARSAIVSASAAEDSYAAALAVEPDIACHHRPVGVNERFVGMDAASAAIEAALAHDPSHARAHAARGNIAARRGNRAEAMGAYAVAVLLDWDFADAQLALAQLYDTADNAADGAQHLAEALARSTLYRARARFAARRILALKTPGGYLANALIDFCIDPNRTDVDVLYITPDCAALPPLDQYAAVYNAISEREDQHDTIARCIALLAPIDRSIINHPRGLATVRRERLRDTLREVPNALALPALRVSREALLEADHPRSPLRNIELPVLLRPVDAHRGDALERIDEPSGLADYARRTPAAHLHLTPFVDYRSPDGYYRKYRVAVVDGVPFPYHLAISDEWMVHYWRAQPLMRQHAWMRDEERQFLRNPEAFFPTWTTTFGSIAAATGLDVFVVDCTVVGEGNVFVFECDPSGFVHCRDDPNDVFAYKYDFVPRIFAAIDELITARAAEAREDHLG